MGTSGAQTRLGGALRVLKVAGSSVTSAFISAAALQVRQASSTMATRPVFWTELRMVATSMGTSVRGSTTSMDIPSPSNSSATLRASVTIYGNRYHGNVAAATLDIGDPYGHGVFLLGYWASPKPGFEFIFDEMKHMGQELFNPPSVEGWHTGSDWIDGGTLVHRINFTADFVGDINYPGIQGIIERLASESPTISPEWMVDGCIQMLGHYELDYETHRMLVAHAQKDGELRTNTEEFSRQVGQMLQMIVATKEYLYA